MSTVARTFDDRVDLAWRDFRGWYADTLLTLADGDAVDVRELHPDLQHDEGTSQSRVAVLTHRDRDTFVVWWCDHSQGLAHALDPDELGGRLAHHGFAPRPGREQSRDRVHERRFDRARVDELATVVVSLVRHDLGVLHPLLLDLDDQHWEPSAAVSIDAAEARVPRPPAIAWPTSAEELDRLVDVTLVPLLGSLPSRDHDGDVPISCGEGMVWVSSHQDGTRLRLMSFLVDDVRDDAAGLAEAGRINREFDVVKARYADGTVQVVVDVRTEPFAADVVRREVAALCGFVQTFGPSAARALGGRTWLGEAADHDETVSGDDDDDDDDHGAGGDVTVGALVDRARRRLRQLDALEPGGLSAVEVAMVCEDDPDVVTGLVELAERALVAWCEQRDQVAPGQPGADPDEHRVLDAEREVAADWLLTTRLALKHLLLG